MGTIVECLNPGTGTRRSRVASSGLRDGRSSSHWCSRVGGWYLQMREMFAGITFGGFGELFGTVPELGSGMN